MPYSSDVPTKEQRACAEITIHCRHCGRLVANISVVGELTIDRAKQYGEFVLRVHNDAFHAAS